MRYKHDWSNLIKESVVCGFSIVIRYKCAGLELYLRCVESVEDGVTNEAGTGPLLEEEESINAFDQGISQNGGELTV